MTNPILLCGSPSAAECRMTPACELHTLRLSVSKRWCPGCDDELDGDEGPLCDMCEQVHDAELHELRRVLRTIAESIMGGEFCSFCAVKGGHEEGCEWVEARALGMAEETQ